MQRIIFITRMSDSLLKIRGFKSRRYIRRFIIWKIQITGNISEFFLRYLTLMWPCAHRDKFLIIKSTRCINFSNLFLEWNATCFGQFLCPSSGVFHCTHSTGICHTGLLTAGERPQTYALDRTATGTGNKTN